MRLTLFPLAVGLTILSSAAFAASRPVVVELFTSQGCSSCPPADAYLTELATRADVLPLAFHVTYWNSLGWRDPFSSEAATERQAAYAGHLGGGSYTPEIVVDGRHGMVGSDRGDVSSAIAVARGGGPVFGPCEPRRVERRSFGLDRPGKRNGAGAADRFRSAARDARRARREQRPDAYGIEHRSFDTVDRRLCRNADQAFGATRRRAGRRGDRPSRGRSHHRRRAIVGAAPAPKGASAQA